MKRLLYILIFFPLLVFGQASDPSFVFNGGSFGDTYTLVSVTGGSGSNPVTDNTYTSSQFLVLDLDAGDRVTNIKIVQ